MRRERRRTPLISTALPLFVAVVLLAFAGIPLAGGSPGPITNLNTDPIVGDDSGHRSAVPVTGFIRVSPNRKFFQFPDGRPFVPVGLNESFDQSLLFDRARLDDYFSHLTRNGVNTVRILLDGWGDSLVELRVGQFNPVVVQAIDNLVAAAEEHGIYLLIALWHNLNEHSVVPLFVWAWAQHPYNVIQPDGLVPSGMDLLSDTAAMDAQKNRMAYFIERWGASPNIFAWEFWNEIDAMRVNQHPSATDTLHQQNMWIDRIGAFVRQEEIKRFGQHRLRTVSVSNAGWGTSAAAVYTGKELDFTSYHTYDFHHLVGVDPWTGERGNSPVHPIRYFQFTYESARLAVAKSALRPVLGTEDAMIIPRDALRAPAFQGFTQQQLDDLFAGTIWAGVLGGGAGANMRWTGPFYQEGPGPDHGYRGLSNGMYAAQKAMATILTDRTVDWGRFHADDANDSVLPIGSGVNLDVKALSDRNNMLVLLVDKDEAFDRKPIRTDLRFQSLKDGRYRVTWYDVRTGEILGRESAYGPAFTLRTPEFRTFAVAVVAGRFAQGQENRPPTAKVFAPAWAYPGSSVLLDGSMSTDLDGGTLSYHWEQVEGPETVDLASTPGHKNGSVMVFTPLEEGEYAFALKVFNGSYWSNLDYAYVLVSYDMPASCQAVRAGGPGREGMTRSDLFFVMMLFLPTLATRSYWKRKLTRVQ
jgi:hypothetical protein